MSFRTIWFFFFVFSFSCLAPELAQGGSGALRVDALPGFRESLFLSGVLVWLLGCLRSPECGCSHRAGVFII